MASDFLIRITSADGTQRRRFPLIHFASARWSIERYGFYSDFTLETSLDFNVDALPNILAGDRVEFYYMGVRRYRGYITGKTPSEGDPQKLVLSGYGASMWLSKQICQKRYVFPDLGTDVATVFAQFAKEWLTPVLLPQGGKAVGTVDAQLLGTTLTTLDAWRKKSGDILASIIKGTGNLATWGVDVNDDASLSASNNASVNRAFMRPIASTATAMHVLPVPSRNVESAQAELQTADVVNVVMIVGGTSLYPQLLKNGDFNLPTLNADQQNSLILNGGFEANSGGTLHQADNWSMNAGASVEAGESNPPEHAAAFAGSRYAETDHAGENFVQIRTGQVFTAGHNYLLSFRAAKKIDTQTLSGHCLFEWLSSSSATLQSFTIPVVPPDDTWSYYSLASVPPTGSAGFRVTGYLDSITPQCGNQGGLVWDNVQLYDNDIAYQDSMILQPQNTTGVVNAVNWVYQDPAANLSNPYAGGGEDTPYALYADVTAADADGQDLQLRPPDGARFKVQPGQQLRFEVYVKSPLTSLHPHLPKFELEFDWFDGSNGYLSRFRTPFDLAPGGTLANWTCASIVATAPSGCAMANVTLTFRGTGSILVKLMSVRDAAAPSMSGGAPYLPEGPQVFLIPASSSLLPAGSSYSGSAAQWGTLAEIVPVSSVLTQADALEYLDAYYTANGRPLRHPQVTILGDARRYLPGESMRWVGRIGQLLCPETLTIVRVEESYENDGLFRCSPQMDRELPDPTLVEKKLIQQELLQYGPGFDGSSSGGGYSNPSNGSGSQTPAQAGKRIEYFTGNGSTTVFTLLNLPISGSVEVYSGGVFQNPAPSSHGIQGWSLSGQSVNANAAPENGAAVAIVYLTTGVAGVIS